MANELTRKGIAFGAAVALGSTLVVGGAATAAPNANYQDLELTAADYGDSNGVLATTLDHEFGLVLSWNGDVNTSNFDDLAYDVTWTDESDEDGEGYGYATWTEGYYEDYDDDFVADTDSWWGTDVTGLDAPHAGGTFMDTNGTDGSYTGPVPAWDITESYTYDEDGQMDDWGVSIILNPDESADEKMVATVQAYIDSNGNDVIDNNETHSAAVDVTFWNPEALTPVLTLEDDGVVYSTVGTGSIGFEVTFAQALNDVWTGDYEGYNNWGEDWYGDSSAYDSEDLWVESYVDGASRDEDYLSMTYNEDDVLYDSGSIDYDVVDGVEDLGSSVTKVRAAMYNDATGDTYYTAWQEVTVVAPQVDYVDNYVVEQDYVAADLEDAVIRSDVESLEYVVEFWDEDDEDVLVSGVDATVYVHNGLFDTDEDAQDWLDDYGVEIAGAEAEIVEVGADYEIEWAVEGTSDADGAITLDISVENPDADLYLEVDSVSYEGSSDELDGDLNWDDTAYDVTFDSALEGDEDEDNYTVAVGGSFDFTAYVVDQWSQAPQDDVRLQWYSDTRGGWDYKYFDVDSDGSVEISLTDGDAEYGEETNTRYYINELQVKDGSAWESGVSWDGDYELYIDWLTDDAVVDYVTAEFTEDSVGTSNGDFFSGNWLFAGWSEDAYNAALGEDGNGDYVWLEGYVHAENGNYIGGAAVTISGTGLFIDDYYGERVATNSITIHADEDGYYGVYISSNMVGEKTVTVTSGGKSTTDSVVFDDRNLYASAVAVSPFTGKAGTSENITATVTDRFGNLVPEVEVSFSVAGGGYFVDDVDTTGGDAGDNAIEDVADAGYGQASEMLVILSNEVGYGSTVTATIDVVDPFGVEDDTTASASLAAGATDFGKPAFWTKDLGDGTLKLYAKNIVGAGKIQFFHNGKEVAWIKAVDALDPKLRAANGSYYLVRTVKLVSGKNVLEIKDDGVRVVRRVASK